MHNCAFIPTVLLIQETLSIVSCVCVKVCVFCFSQNPLLDGGELTTYIGTVATKPGSPDNSASFSQWQKKGVRKTHSVSNVASLCSSAWMAWLVQQVVVWSVICTWLYVNQLHLHVHYILLLYVNQLHLHVHYVCTSFMQNSSNFSSALAKNSPH